MIISKETLDRLMPDIKKQEGFKPFPYKDAVGKLTIGYGFNLDDVGLSPYECDLILENRLEGIEKALAGRFKTFYELGGVRQSVLLDMAYNVGVERLMGFANMLADIERHDYGAAADEMLQSKWAKQVGWRATLLAGRMRSGKYES